MVGELDGWFSAMCQNHGRQEASSRRQRVSSPVSLESAQDASRVISSMQPRKTLDSSDVVVDVVVAAAAAATAAVVDVVLPWTGNESSFESERLATLRRGGVAPRHATRSGFPEKSDAAVFASSRRQ